MAERPAGLRTGPDAVAAPPAPAPVVSFPHLGDYKVAFKPLLEILDCPILIAPPLTRRTIELGAKHSPEAACIPFKYMLGNYIEALDQGATVLLQAGGGCRFGFYGEVQKEILRSLGYRFTFLKLNDAYRPSLLMAEIRKVNPRATYLQLAHLVALAYCRARALENLEDYVRRNIGFEARPGELERAMRAFLADLEGTRRRREVREVERDHRARLEQIPVNRPENPLRVGVVGEVYVLMEPFSNYGIEQKLGRQGVEIHRFVTVSGIVRDFFHNQKHVRDLVREASPYLEYHIGAHGTESVAMALRLIRQGYDGIIHIKPFGCMPEVSAMSPLHRISRDHGVPILYFSFDAQTSETGINTRLEAFHDMLEMRRRKR